KTLSKTSFGETGLGWSPFLLPRLHNPTRAFLQRFLTASRPFPKPATRAYSHKPVDVLDGWLRDSFALKLKHRGCDRLFGVAARRVALLSQGIVFTPQLPGAQSLVE